MNNLLEYKIDLIAAHLGVYKIEDVSSVILRRYVRTDGEDALLVDFYPEWNAQGTYGKMKVASEYLDHQWQKDRFEKYSGLKLADMPLLEADQAIRRRFGQTHRNEVIPPRPFRLMIQPRQDSEGNNEKTLILRYLTGARQGKQPSAPAEASTPAPTASKPPVPAPGSVTIPDKDWLSETLNAANQDDFVISISRLHSELFADANQAARLWGSMFGNLTFNPVHTAAYLNGMKVCAERFAAEQSAGKEKAVAYAEAKTAGLDKYEETLDYLASGLKQAEMPLGGGNNYARR